MKHRWILGLLPLLSACEAADGDGLPDERHVQRIEQRLAANPCIGDLRQWERLYRFADPGGFSAYTAHPNFDVIDFHLRRAGTTTITPGRVIVPRGERRDWPDDRFVQSIDGSYKIGEDRMTLIRVPRCQRQGRTVTSK
ncbi:hypothetical protein H9L12_07270 [Sphingomonas rhizophila]|uniref:Lipoprotein n=1 Tax=Sphingomonas rhizophila TaxID=2071607 RepID=A0A7G9S8K4_9SPHN|nr:hypothetical protein [Sphingomonas rhizophila]QNN64179.1 hypothetical protein H9L12_07270 [Sphingomonas rhizophila]